MNNIVRKLFRGHKFSIPVFWGLAVYLLFRQQLNGFWRGDDSVILLHTLRNSLADIFLEPNTWQAFSQVNLTPWMLFSFQLDYSLAGMNPQFFYWHQLAALMLVALASYLLLALFVSRIWALAGSLLFLLGAPVASVAAQLMTRHYIEGLLFALLSVYFFFRYQRGDARIFLFVSVGCFVIAVTAKETYVPLGLLFILLTSSSSSLRERAWQSLPFAAVILAYVVWRSHMLPGLVDGYVVNTRYFTLGFWLEVAVSLLAIPGLILGPYMVPILGLFALLLACTFRRFPEYWLVFLVCAGLICGPLIPLIYFPGILVPDRYVLLPWYMFCFASAFFTGKLLESSSARSRVKSGTAVFLWALVCLVVPRARVDYLDDIADHFRIVDTQMRFFWNENNTIAFIPTAEVAGALYMLPAMKELKLMENPQVSAPIPVIDDKFLDQNRPVFAYSAACVCMADISADIPARLQHFSDNQQSERPLSLDISNEDGLMSWNFGPYTDGVYTVIIGGMGSVILPKAQTKLRTLIRDEVDFYLRYDAPDGWFTYSALTPLKPDGMPARWEKAL